MSVVFDASSLVGALLKPDSVPERALLLARSYSIICLSPEVAAEVREVFARPKFVHAWPRANVILQILIGAASWHAPTVAVTDCRDLKDNKYLELALEAGADTIISSDADLLSLHPWRGIDIITPAAYVARFEAQPPVA